MRARGPWMMMILPIPHLVRCPPSGLSRINSCSALAQFLSTSIHEPIELNVGSW